MECSSQCTLHKLVTGCYGSLMKHYYVLKLKPDIWGVVALNDLEGLSQPKPSYDSMIYKCTKPHPTSLPTVIEIPDAQA